ncbi:hypothetical protein EGW08_017971 [Elysia chlorotica]|uniref:C-type lectin domain-containing protein n=1 Tax=Elysia chlorotica TaxID=188477 RepID=A0A3S0ZC29_ELYCH|nr:hypothetical protein EGW08_017971 [Elysia chlorotica]
MVTLRATTLGQSRGTMEDSCLTLYWHGLTLSRLDRTGAPIPGECLTIKQRFLVTHNSNNHNNNHHIKAEQRRGSPGISKIFTLRATTLGHSWGTKQDCCLSRSPYCTEEGVYGCVARGLDSLGHLVTMTSSILVKRSSDLDRFRDALVKVRQTLQQSQSCCTSLHQRVASLEWTYSRLTLTLAHIEKNTVLTPRDNYLDHRYYASKYLVNAFATGKAVCEVVGGYLAEISDAAENSAVIGIVGNAQPRLPGYYLGAQDSQQEKQWVWLHNNTQMLYSDWQPGEPNNLGDEDCMEIILRPSGIWNWNDIKCERVTYDKGFLCEV